MTKISTMHFFLKGNIIPAICIAIMANVPDRPYLAVTLLTVGIAMSAIQFGSGFLVNAVDIAPRYAGSIMAFSNCVAAIGGFLAPFAAGIITEDVSKAIALIKMSWYQLANKHKNKSGFGIVNFTLDI